MVCPRCRFALDPTSSGNCPNCGMHYERLTSVVMKTSSVLIASRGFKQVYRSVSEVPSGLRKQLEDSTNGSNSGTILIADRRGKEEIAKAMQRIGEAESEPPADQNLVAGGWRAMGLSRWNWLGVAIGFASGALLWLVCVHHW